MENTIDLTDLVQRRDNLRANTQRIQGRLESAQTELATVESECRAKKIDPATIDTVISQLEGRLVSEKQSLSEQIEAAEAQIKPYLSNGGG